MPAVLPRPSDERIASIDVLRGIAVLGILLVNIQSFAMPDAAYLDPRAYGDLTGANAVVWHITHVLAANKFITIFSLLFGAGIALRDINEPTATSRFVRRQFVLLVIGLIHAYLLWPGDILVGYALVGLIVFPYREARVTRLILTGAAFFSAGLIVLAIGAAAIFAIPADELEAARFALRDPSMIAAEVDAFRGPWIEQQRMRFALATYYQLYGIPFYVLPFTTGLMFAGIALLRGGFFTGEWSAAAYRMTIAIGFGVGPTILAFEYWLDAKWSHDPVAAHYVFPILTLLAAVPMALAYAAIVVCVTPRLASALTSPLAAVGRTALTCYLAQTVICTSIFYGFGWFGQVSRVGQASIVVAIWIALLLAAPWWLRRFQQGPMEWLWRSVAEGRFRPLLRADPR